MVNHCEAQVICLGSGKMVVLGSCPASAAVPSLVGTKLHYEGLCAACDN